MDTKKLPPLGPMGKSNSYRAKMYRHNRMVAARRAKMLNENEKAFQDKNPPMLGE